MSAHLTIFLIAVSLSMDTFSLSLCYGTLNLSKQKTILLSIIVGIFHFFMPLIGMNLGNMIIDKLIIDGKYIIMIILTFIGIDMILSALKNEEKNLLVSFFGILLFAFSVSLDSFSTGLGLRLITNEILESVFIFSIISALFTYAGIKLGRFLSVKYGKIANIIGGVILILLGISFILH